jgi:DNA invertase Pin-like site-specific DNA recombinase
MTTVNEPAGIWVRVSTGAQDEAQQMPDIMRHCEARGYRVACRYELNDISAYKGKQDEKLAETIEDFREGHIKVLVCWHSDRVERRGPEALFKLLRQIKDAGGRIESVREPMLGVEDMSGEAMTAIGAVMAHQYSVNIGENVKRSIRTAKANGAVYNRPPWGFTAVGPAHEKRLIPTEECRELVPQILQRCIDGDSLRTIARWLDSAGYPPANGGKHWNESQIRHIIRNRVYAGRWLNRSGVTILRCEAVVTPDMWDRANQALKSRPKRGPAKDDRPLLANLKCARCGSPMYRITIPGRHGSRYTYYRCFGSGPQRKGCGNMVPLEQTETIIAVRVFMTSTESYRTREWVEGTSWDNEISEVKQDLREAVDAERFEDIPALQATLAEYRRKNEEESVPGHWEYRDTKVTVGDYFDKLDAAGKREYLKTRDIRVEKATPADPGATRGVRVIIDGEDHGVFGYPA